ncbi:ABC transporter permease [Aegicerativicinus sediminis]|uniref:ABC transporter permease n=1 Tax=Aegicerativicinus sediminis TaxID=2893202 RepID=UPI001E2C21C2|nr:FtsX-like permease family protein [Aegicerativicinus sediminis]
MNVSLYIAKRYLFSKSSNNAINIMTGIAAIGTVIASAALFIVLSGFAGLKDFSLEFTSFVDPDLSISPSKGKSFEVSEDQLDNLKRLEGIQGVSLIVAEKSILEVENKRQIVTLKGVDSLFNNVTDVDSLLIGGYWMEPSTPQIVAGGGIANSLSFGVLDFAKRLTIYVPKPGKGQFTSMKGAFRTVRVSNVGIFDINEELNNSVVYANIETVRYLLNYAPNTVTEIELKLGSGSNEAELRQEIASIFTDSVLIKNRAQLNDALYKMLNTENMAVYLIFTLVIIIALFNVIGALIMMILDKKESLNTLFNLGLPVKSIKRVFFLQGSLMTVLGGLFGALLGLVIVVLQQQFDLVMITPSLPYPVAIQAINLVIVIATIVVLGLLASKVASTRISENLVKT